jgi:hypothetical protein
MRVGWGTFFFLNVWYIGVLVLVRVLWEWVIEDMLGVYIFEFCRLKKGFRCLIMLYTTVGLGAFYQKFGLVGGVKLNEEHCFHLTFWARCSDGENLLLFYKECFGSFFFFFFLMVFFISEGGCR